MLSPKLSSTHIDFHYKEDTEVDCDKDQCCRKGKETTIKKIDRERETTPLTLLHKCLKPIFHYLSM